MAVFSQDPSRSLRNPAWESAKQVADSNLPGWYAVMTSLGTLWNTQYRRVHALPVHCARPDRGVISRRSTSAWFELTMFLLSQAPPLDGLHRVARLPFRASAFTTGLHPPVATAQRLITYLHRPWSFPLIPSSRFVAHIAHNVLYVIARCLLILCRFQPG